MKDEEGVAFPAVMGTGVGRAQVEIVRRKQEPVRKPSLVGERVDEAMQSSRGGGYEG